MTLPYSIPFADVEAMLRNMFGIDATEVVAVNFGMDGVTVELVRADADNRMFGFGNNIATVTTQIAYDRSPPACA